MLPEYTINALKDEIRRYQLALAIAEKFRDQLSESVIFSPSSYLTISVDTREDLQVLMTMGSLWKKRYFGSGIYYVTEINNEEVTLIAHEGALPETCKVVEEEQVIAAQPEQRITRKVIKCDL